MPSLLRRVGRQDSWKHDRRRKKQNGAFSAQTWSKTDRVLNRPFRSIPHKILSESADRSFLVRSFT